MIVVKKINVKNVIYYMMEKINSVMNVEKLNVVIAKIIISILLWVAVMIVELDTVINAIKQ